MQIYISLEDGREPRQRSLYKLPAANNYPHIWNENINIKSRLARDGHWRGIS